jgi:hypothetical protein
MLERNTCDRRVGRAALRKHLESRGSNR